MSVHQFDACILTFFRFLPKMANSPKNGIFCKKSASLSLKFVQSVQTRFQASNPVPRHVFF